MTEVRSPAPIEAAEQPPLDVRLLPATVVCWALTALGVTLGARAALLATPAVVLAVVIAAAVLSGVVRASGVPPASLWAGVLALTVLAAAYGLAVAAQAHAVAEHPVAAAAQDRAWITADARIEEDPRRLRSAGPAMVMVTARLERAEFAGRSLTLGGRVRIIAPQESWSAVLPGQTVTLRGRLAAPSRADLTVASIRVSGSPVKVSQPPWWAAAANSIRTDLSAAAQNSMPSDRAGLLPGLVVGDVSMLDETVAENFRAAGLTHLTAVSGANFSIVLGAVLLLLRGIGVGPRTTASIAFLALVALVIIARPSPSVVRAAVMGSIGLLALVTGRRRQAIPALCTAVLGAIAWWPRLAVDFGFALSVFATAGLVLLAPVWADRLRGYGWARAPAEVVAVAAAAHAVTAPVVASMAGTFSVVGIAANIAVAPVIAPITVVGALTAVLGQLGSWPAETMATLSSAPLWWLVTVAERAAAVPVAAVPTPDGLAGGALVVGGSLALLVAARFAVLRWCMAIVVVAGLTVWVVHALLAFGGR